MTKQRPQGYLMSKEMNAVIKRAELVFDSNLVNPDTKGTDPSNRYQLTLKLTDEQAEVLKSKYNANIRYYNSPESHNYNPDKDTVPQITIRTKNKLTGSRIVDAAKRPYDLQGQELPWGTLVNASVFFSPNPRKPNGPNQNLMMAVQVLQVPQFKSDTDGFTDESADFADFDDDFNEDSGDM